LDFAEAFDKMSHTYLFEILRSYGFSDRFLERVRMIYTKAVSVMQINGHMSGPLPIGCSIRQGCPLSMALFALCINPLIQCLEENLQGVRFNRGQRMVAVVAYAENITILVKASEDIERLKEIIQCYERAMGARLNFRKSQALPVGTWDLTRSVMGIPYSVVVTILGFEMASETETSRGISWSRLTASVKEHASEA
jgi:GTP cyclohydrolase FolE2